MKLVDRCKVGLLIGFVTWLIYPPTQGFPASVDKLVKQWRGMVTTGAVNSARSEARLYLAENGTDSDVLLFLAEIETDPKAHQKLLEEAQAAATPSQRRGVLQLLAETAYLEERYQDAIPYLQELTSNDSTNRMLKFLLGCCYRRVGDYSQATVSFYELFTAGQQDELFLAAAFNLAEIYEEQGLQEDAIRYYRTVANDYSTIGEMARTKLKKVGGVDVPKVADPHPAKPEGSPRSIEEITESAAFQDRLPQYLVQVGAFSQRRNAEAMQVELAAMGYPVIVTASQQNKKNVYRVRVGPYKDRLDAQAVVDKLASNKKKPIFSYVIRIDEPN